MLEEIGKQKLPYVINDPFKKNKITSVSVWGSESWLNPGHFTFSGRVEFTNGQTKGEQNFEGDSFDHVVLKIKSMLDNLE